MLFLDEPTASLDGKTTLEIEKLLQNSAENGTTIMMSTHDIGQAKRLAKREAALAKAEAKADKAEKSAQKAEEDTEDAEEAEEDDDEHARHREEAARDAARPRPRRARAGRARHQSRGLDPARARLLLLPTYGYIRPLVPRCQSLVHRPNH